MPGLSFSGQRQSKRPGGWIVPVVLIVVSVLLITISARVEGGVLGAMRNGVQAVSAPLQSVCSVISTPFKNLGSGSSAMSTEEADQLRSENEQLKTLVAELEEYRQQDQRLTSLMALSDTYALQTVSGQVVNKTTGWDKTATINIGSDNGVQVGMGVMSSCGLYGQIESVTSNSSVVRRIDDADSSVAAMIQGTRATGVLSGSYEGVLTLEYVSVENTVGEGDVVISSGGGGTYPKGIIIGTVKEVEVDSSKLYYRITVTPIQSISACEEVLVLTGREDATASLVDQDLLDSITSSIISETLSDTSSAGQTDQSEEDDTAGADDATDAKDASGKADATDDEDASSDADAGGSKTDDTTSSNKKSGQGE